MTALGPRIEERIAYERAVRVVQWFPKRYACDGCGTEITEEQRIILPLPGDWCSIDCHMTAPSTPYCWPTRPVVVRDWDDPRGTFGTELRRG